MIRVTSSRGRNGGILGLGASFSLLKVRDILGPQFGVSAGGMLCSHESWEARDMQCTLHRAVGEFNFTLLLQGANSILENECSLGTYTDSVSCIYQSRG